MDLPKFLAFKESPSVPSGYVQCLCEMRSFILGSVPKAMCEWPPSSTTASTKTTDRFRGVGEGSQNRAETPLVVRALFLLALGKEGWMDVEEGEGEEERDFLGSAE